jgi:type III pantothenate kinase
MLLAIDVGNSEITLGLFSGDRPSTGDRPSVQWRMTTVTARTSDEWMSTLTAYLEQAGHSPNEIRAAVCASVAPAVTQGLVEGVEKAVGVAPVSIGPASKLPIVLDVDEPMTVGADRVVNTLAASQLYKKDTIVVDFGTATTFDCITADAHFIGGVIAPGLQTAVDDLTRKTAKLPATELTAPATAIGKRTEDCVRAGVLLGHVDMTDGLVRRIKAEWPNTSVPFVVATGGLASRVVELSQEIEQIEPSLTLIGLRIAAAHLDLHW